MSKTSPTTANTLKLRNEIAQKLVQTLLAEIPEGATQELATEIHLGTIWRFVFATMATTMDARSIRHTVDAAIRARKETP